MVAASVTIPSEPKEESKEPSALSCSNTACELPATEIGSNPARRVWPAGVMVDAWAAKPRVTGLPALNVGSGLPGVGELPTTSPPRAFIPEIRDAFTVAPEVVYSPTVPLRVETKRSEPETAMPYGSVSPEASEALTVAPAVVYSPIVPVEVLVTNRSGPEMVM